MSLSKLYKSQMAAFSRDNKYTLAEAINILKSMPHPKFDETVELAIKLGVDTRKSDQTVRGAVALPAVPVNPSKSQLLQTAHRLKKLKLPEQIMSVTKISLPKSKTTGLNLMS